MGRASLQDARKATQRPLLPAAVLENRNKGLIKSAPSRGLIPAADTVACVGPTGLHGEGQGCCPSSGPRSPHKLGECLWRHRSGCECNFRKLVCGFRSLTKILDLPSLCCPVSMSLELHFRWVEIFVSLGSVGRKDPVVVECGGGGSGMSVPSHLST